VNAANKQGRTPLHLAVGNGHEQMCIELLDAGAQVQRKDNTGQTPMDLVAGTGETQIAELLGRHLAKR
jgi:cytohesin